MIAIIANPGTTVACAIGKWSTTSREGGRTVSETRVDLLHLLEDLRDAYPGSLEENILTEIVASSLDRAPAV